MIHGSREMTVTPSGDTADFRTVPIEPILNREIFVTILKLLQTILMRIGINQIFFHNRQCTSLINGYNEKIAEYVRSYNYAIKIEFNLQSYEVLKLETA